MNNTDILSKLAVEMQLRSTTQVVLESVAFLILWLFNVIGNSMTVTIVYKNRHLRRVPN